MSASCEDLGYADDLVFEVVLAGEIIVIPNLTGFRCVRCGKVTFDTNSTKIIEKYTAGKPAGGYELKISIVGGGKLGIYFPKDVLRIMKINKGDSAILTCVSERKMIIELLS